MNSISSLVNRIFDSSIAQGRRGILSPPMPLHIVEHPLIEDALAQLRDRRTGSEEFRRLARRVGLLLAAAATGDLPAAEATVETPLETARVRRLATRVVAVPVLRAGLGLLDAFLEIVPSAEIGYLGLERNEETAVARRYYEKVPRDLGAAVVFVLDPMLATGGSAAMAVEGLWSLGARSVRLLSVGAAPEGVRHLESQFPDTLIFTAAVDRALNDRKYILPGLGDFGDRLYGT
jgi:uracil phosphoribosyltransferase